MFMQAAYTIIIVFAFCKQVPERCFLFNASLNALWTLQFAVRFVARLEMESAMAGTIDQDVFPRKGLGSLEMLKWRVHFGIAVVIW